MKGSFVPVTTDLYLNEREKWLQEIRRGENVSVIFFPKTDRFRRLHQLLEDKDFLRKFFGPKGKYLFQLTDFNISLVEDQFDIQEHIARQLNESSLTNVPHTFTQWMSYFLKENIHVVLILADAEKYLTVENKHIPPLLFRLSIDFAPTLTLMNFLETDITHPSYTSMLTLSKELYENLFWYPLYSEPDVRGFVQYLRTKWNMTLPKKQEDKIVELCGGHFWLVKEAAREFLNNGKFSIDNEALFFRTEALYQALQQSEQRVVEKIMTNKKQFTDEERHSHAYFKKMNFLSKNNGVNIGLISQYVSTRPHIDQHVEVNDGRVFINNVTVDSLFTKKERRVFKALVEHKGEIVSRDTIAQSMWQSRTDQQYSDWAIDQIITRLRKKLIELSLSPQLIHSVRGKGYRFNY
jgi:DNA-binding winged helix-turn-helix (wHTH) protein